MPTASTLMQKSAEILNDAERNMWNDDVLLPMLVLAFQELELEYVNHSLPALMDLSSPQVVAAGLKSLAPVVDFLAPISLEERGVGEDDTRWVEMSQRTFEPDTINKSNSLIYWAYREQEFKFVGATQAREIRYRYYKNFDQPDDATSNISVLNSTLFLQFKTAANAARYIGQRPTLADTLDNNSTRFLHKAMNREVKSIQNMPKRRKGFGWARKRLGSYLVR